MRAWTTIAGALIQHAVSVAAEARVIVHEESITNTVCEIKAWAGREVPIIRFKGGIPNEKPYGKKARRRNRGGKY